MTEKVTKEELAQGLEDAANFMRGMGFDSEVPQYAINALQHKAKELDDLVQRYLDGEDDE